MNRTECTQRWSSCHGILVIVCLTIQATALHAAADSRLSTQLADETVGSTRPLSPQPWSGVRPQDEVWFISTRQLGWPHGQQVTQPNFEVRHFDPTGQSWQDSSVDTLLDKVATPVKTKPITVFYVHGNRTDRAGSFGQGWAAYRAILGQEVNDRPVRLVIWSWPSQQVEGPLRDIRAKAARTDPDGYYLGWLLSQMDSQAPVSLIGYSYGARIILGGLHLSSGGRLCGQSLPLSGEQPISRVRVVLLAAAEHSHWLMPGRNHDHAYLRIGNMLVLYNSCDPVLRRYRWVDRCADPQAMGYAGVTGQSSLADDGRRIRQRDVRCIVGRSHDLSGYFCSSLLGREIHPYVFWEPVD